MEGFKLWKILDLSSILISNGDFIKEQYGSYLNSDKRPTIITSIRIAIQQICGTIDNPLLTNNQ